MVDGAAGEGCTLLPGHADNKLHGHLSVFVSAQQRGPRWPRGSEGLLLSSRCTVTLHRFSMPAWEAHLLIQSSTGLTTTARGVGHTGRRD